MDIVKFAEETNQNIDSVIDDISTFFWSLFSFIHKNVFDYVHSFGAEALSYLSFTIIALWLAALKFSKILPGEKSWQLFLLRTLVAKSILYLTPIALFVWIISALSFSGSKLAEDFYDSLISYLAFNAHYLKQGAIWGGITGLFLVFSIGRFIEPAIDRWLNRATNKESKNQKLNDVREVQEDLPKPIEFNPYQFFRSARKLRSLFFGKDYNNNAIYIPRSEWNNSNILLLGPTRRGKGVQACMVLAQCLFFDEPDIIIVIDPKGDDWGPLVLRDACRRAKLPFTYVNARRDQDPQFNPLQGASKEELIALLVAGYDLYPKGSPDDFYRFLEQEAVEQLIERAPNNPTIKELYELSHTLFNEEEAENIQSLLSKLKQDSKLNSINTKTGPTFDQLLNTGGVYWFVGSEDDPSVIRIQRIFSYRSVQFFRNRDNKSRHGTIFADELKHLISGPFYKAFGTILGAGNANIIAAIQSKGDLEDIPQNLNPRAVSKAIFDNTNLKWCYRNNDPETVDWIVEMEGSQVISKERVTVERNMQLAETASSERSITTEEVSFLHRNHVLHLPNSCAILLGFGLAKIAYTSPIKVKKESLQPTHIQTIEEKNNDILPGDDLI